VIRRSKLYELPEGLTGLIPSHLGPMARKGLISPAGKLRMAMDYFIPPRQLDGDESLAAFVERRLGREVYDRMIEPLTGLAEIVEALQAQLGDVDIQLGMRATRPRSSAAIHRFSQRRLHPGRGQTADAN
jgi:hypothetical protein